MAGPFDAVISAEERFHLGGFESGIHQGRLQGKVDGFSTGQVKGIEVGGEIGFYLGFAKEVLRLMNREEREEDRLKRLLCSTVEHIERFRCLDTSSPTYLEDISKIRSKFKQVSSIMKVKEAELLSPFTAKLSF